MKYKKLVRDNIPEIIKKSGETPVTQIAEEQEYEEALSKKLYEEVNEFLEDPSVEEMADVLEVIKAICSLKGVDISKLEEVRLKKAKERGSFDKRIILDRTEEK